MWPWGEKQQGAPLYSADFFFSLLNLGHPHPPGLPGLANKNKGHPV